MKILQVTERREGLSLQEQEIDIPKPGENQILVKVKAAGVNFADIMQYQNKYPRSLAVPYTPGYEVAGDVETIGQSVKGYQVGDAVAGFMPQGGGYAEYALVDVTSCIPLPPGLGYSQATSLLTQGVTAHMIVDKFVAERQRILVTAAAGGVGNLVVQLSLLRGAKQVIAATSDPKKARELEALGAAIVDYSRQDWASGLLCNGPCVDVLLDSVGGDTLLQAWSLLHEFGTIVSYGAASYQGLNLSPDQLMAMYFKNPTLHFFGFTRHIENKPQLLRDSLRHLFQLALSSKLHIKVQEYQGLRQTEQAWQAMVRRKTHGKVAIVI